MRKILFLSAVVMTMLASCSKEDEEAVIGPDPNDKYESSITLTATDLDLPADKGGKAIIRLTVDHEWYLVSNDKEEQTWLEADLTHGVSTKNKRITFTALEEGLAETRTAKFKIVSGANSKKFTVTQGRKCLILTMDDVQDFDKYYKPLEFDFDMLRSDSKWSWCRSKQTEHVVVFWDKQYGEYGLYGDRMGVANTSPTTCKSSKMRVDIDDLLKKAEEFYKINTETLKFSEPGTGKSVLDDYKFEIYILYQSEWLATGSAQPRDRTQAATRAPDGVTDTARTEPAATLSGSSAHSGRATRPIRTRRLRTITSGHSVTRPTCTCCMRPRATPTTSYSGGGAITMMTSHSWPRCGATPSTPRTPARPTCVLWSMM